MQSFGDYAIRNSGGFHQESLIDSDDDPPESNSIIIKKRLSDDSLSSIEPLSVSLGISSPTPSSPSSISSNEGPIDDGRLTPVTNSPSNHSLQNSPAPSYHHYDEQCILSSSELHDELKSLNDSPHHPSLPGERMPMLGKALSWVSPKLSPRTTKTGCGLFCAEPVKKGEYLVVWTGKIVSADQALSVMSTNEKHYILQIGEGFYQTPLQAEREAADLSNHSCEPTAGFGANSPIALTAVRDLSIGEEVVFDYGMCETDERLWEPMECACGSKYCRGLITANDWKREDLWERYDGLWAPHVKKLVDAAKEEKQKILLKEQKAQENASAIIDETIKENGIISSSKLSAKDDFQGSYYKAAPLPAHWLGRMFFPIVDSLLAKIGLARVLL